MSIDSSTSSTDSCRLHSLAIDLVVTVYTSTRIFVMIQECLEQMSGDC